MNGQHENSHSADQHGRLQQVESHVLQRLGKGFLVLIPLLATLIIVSYSIGAFVDVLRPFIDGFTQVPFIASVPAIEVFTWIVFVGVVLGTFYFAGALVSAGSRRRVVQLQNAMLSRIPVVKSIYGVVRQATEALSTGSQHEFSRVVFVEWPRPGVTAMGLVTGHCRLPDSDAEKIVVYIPTVPNPTSGMLAILDQDQVTETDISVEEAMKMVFSGGIVLPDMMMTGSRNGEVRRSRQLPERQEAEASETPAD
ncbi:MAG: DUF502 domain-containing protein [SAR202 cluster bacterium]|nr:DUF502 domain-containing protein [SAR202 cluster bacterium]